MSEEASEKPSGSDTMNSLVMTEDQRKEFLRNVFYRQNKLAANSNFAITGFDQHRFGSLLQAFAEELGLIKIES